MQTIAANNSISSFLIRYILGVIMMAYGLIKIFHIQFALPSEVYDYQLRQLDGVTLTWAFLGFSPWFSFLLGLFELVPGFLLLFRKTRLLGAILLLPSLVAVFLINNAYNFLPHMRILTGVLLICNVILLTFDYKVLLQFLKDIMSQSSFHVKELILNAVILGVLTSLILYYLM